MSTWFKKLIEKFSGVKAPQPEPVVEKVRREIKDIEAEIVPVAEVSEVDFESMTKLELDIYARNHGIDIDRRRRKDYIIEQIKTQLKEK